MPSGTIIVYRLLYIGIGLSETRAVTLVSPAQNSMLSPSSAKALTGSSETAITSASRKETIRFFIP